MASNGKQKKVGGSFPPNPTQWPAERNGLGIRSRFGIALDAPLRPFDIQLENAVLIATRHELASFVKGSDIDHLLGAHGRRWSGFTIPFEDRFIVVLNETHSTLRKHATLMEEYFHIILRHRPSGIKVCPHTGIAKRTYDGAMEREAYSSSAASLVPYGSMKAMVARGAVASEIAEHFEVSQALADFRLKTCRLYRKAQNNA
jgi:hypothetical protein